MAKKYSLASEFWLFLKNEKKWWLGPVIGILFLLAGFLLFAESSVAAPFIYSLF